MAQSIRVNIIGDTRDYERALTRASGHTSSFGRTLTSLGKTAAVAFGAAGVAGAAVVLKRGFDEIAESAQVAAQTGAVLKSTGQAANVTADQVSNLATEISRMSGIDDEAVQAGENMLLTFTNIRNEAGKGNDIFTQATSVLADFATAMNRGAAPSAEQLTKNAILLGKALNDPVKGMTALRRVGVSFTDDQVKTIKALVDSGRAMDAQKLIIRELTREFGGSAKAAGETLPGQLNKLKNAFDDAAAGIVQGLMPALQRGLGAITEFITRLSAAQGIRAKIKVVADFVITASTGAYKSIRDQIHALLFGEFVKGGPGGVGPEGIRFQQGLIQQLNDWIAGADWRSVGVNIGVSIRNSIRFAGDLGFALSKELGQAARNIDWSQFVKGLAQGLLGSDIPGVLKRMIFTNWKLTNPILAMYGDDAARTFLNAFGGVFKGSDATKASGALKQAIQNAVKAGAATASAESAKLGKDIVEGLAAGIRQNLALAAAAVRVMVINAIQGGHAAAQTGSPSKKMYQLGRDMVEGMRLALVTLGPTLTKAILASFDKLDATVSARVRKMTGTYKSSLAQLEAFAKQEGIAITSTTGGSHVPGSYHYRGQAIDVAGSAAQMRKFFLDAWNTFGANLKELFYDPIGWFVKNGSKVSGAIGGHSDHVHIAMASVKEMTDAIVTQTEADTPRVTAAQAKQLAQIAALTRSAGKVIGLDHARQIVAGLFEGSPGIVAQVRTALQQAMAAAKQAVADAKTGLKQAFADLATSALSGFDEVTAKWKSPALTLLESMQAEDAAAAAQKTIDDAAQAVKDAQAAAEAARAAGPQEGETPEQFAARLAALDAAVTAAVLAQGEALRGVYEGELQKRAEAEETAWQTRRNTLRQHLIDELTDIQTYLAKHPEEYAKTQRRIIATLAKYHVPLKKAGKGLGDAFEEGLSEGIQAVVNAARKLAAALEEIPGVGKGGGGGGTGTTHTGGPGGHYAAGGIVTGRTLALIGERGPEAIVPLGRSLGRMPTGGGNTINVYMPNYLGDARTAAQEIRRELQRIGRDNAINPLAI